MKEEMKMFRKIEIEDLNCNDLDGKYIRKKGLKSNAMIIAFVEEIGSKHCKAILDHDYLNYGYEIPEDILLKDFEIEVQNEKIYI